jgi:hypothetical protein
MWDLKTGYLQGNKASEKNGVKFDPEITIESLDPAMSHTHILSKHFCV